MEFGGAIAVNLQFVFPFMNKRRFINAICFRNRIYQSFYRFNNFDTFGEIENRFGNRVGIIKRDIIIIAFDFQNDNIPAIGLPDFGADDFPIFFPSQKTY